MGCATRRHRIGEGPQEDAEHRQPQRAERHQADLHLAAGKTLAKHRPHTDTQREQRQDQGHHALVAVQQLLGVGRDLRQVHRAEEPEPGVADQRARHRRRLRKAQAHDLPGLAGNIPVQFQLRQRGMGKGNRACRDIPQHRDQHHRGSDDGRVVLTAHHDSRTDGAGQDGQKGAGFNQRVAAQQFFLFQCLRQDRVLDRAEQRGLSAHQEQHAEHQRQIAQQHTGRAGHHDRNLGELDPAHQRILGELLTKLPAKGRKQKERQDEQQRTKIDQQVLVLGASELEQNREDQRLFEDVVVERTEQLSNEKRQKTPFTQQGELRVVGHVPLSPV